MADGAESGKELPVKGRVPQPGPLQLPGEEGKGAPRHALALL